MTVPTRNLAGLLIIGTGTLVAPLDTAVNIAFPYIVGGFGAPMTMIQWVVICYVLTYASLMLVFGKLGDLFGHRRVFAIGLAISAVGLALVALAPSFAWMLVFRFVQGVGTGLVTAVGPALALGLFAEGARGRVLGAYTMMFAVGTAAGPLVGGILVDLFDWRAVFWFRVPIALGALLLIFVLPAGGSARRRRAAPRFDTPGALLLILAMSSFLLTLNQLQRLDGGVLAVAGLGLVFLASTAGFILAEARAAEPIIKLSVFRTLDFAIVNLASCLAYLVIFSVLLLLPFYLYRIADLPVAVAGLLMASGSFGTIAAAPLGGWLLGRVRANRIGFAGIVMVGGGLCAVAGLDAVPDPVWLVAALLAQGIGIGLFQTAYIYIVTGTLPPRDRGVAGGLAHLTRTIGTVTGVTTLTLIFAGFEQAARTAGIAEADSFMPSFRATFLIAGGGLLFFLLLSLARPRVWLGRPAPQG